MVENIVANIVKGLTSTGWDEVLADYWRSKEFADVIRQLQVQVDEGKRFVPAMKDMFKWMRLTPYDSIKVVMLIEDNCNTLSHQGIPFSQNRDKMKKPDKVISKWQGKIIRICGRWEICEFLAGFGIIKHFASEFDFDLERWCKQGVLMMPYSSTCRIDRGPHLAIWHEFRARVIDVVNVKYKDIPVVMVGQRACEYEYLFETLNTLPVTLNPRKSNKNWHLWVNELLVNQNKIPIEWN